MADYIRFRLSAAKLGVTMAFFGLLAGLAEKARATTSPAPAANFLREISVPTGGGLDRIVIQKLDSALATLEHKLNTSFTTTHKLNQTFLKIKSADTSFLKIKSANTSFLKIDDANANFLKIDDANANFLKIDDANSEFLKIDSTAANASELGGLTPDAFFQGSGQVVTGSVPSIPASPAPASELLSLPGGIIVVSVQNPGAGAAPQLIIQNNAGTPLASVVDGSGEHTLAANTTTGIAFTSPAGSQIHLQIFPGGSLAEVVTVIASVENASGNLAAVGQAFAGVPV